MAFDPNSRVFLAKAEATEGVDSSPVVGTDDICVMNDSEGITATVTYDEVMVSSPYGGEVPGGINTKEAAWSLNIPLYGKGVSTNITVPKWAQPILSTLFTLSNEDDNTELVMTLGDPFAPTFTDQDSTTTANARTFTLYEYAGRDGRDTNGTKPLKIATGCRIGTAAFVFPSNGRAMLNLSGVALATEAADVTTDLSGFTNDGVVSDWVYGGNLDLTINNPANDGPQALINQELSITVNTGALTYDGDNNGTGKGGTAIDNVTVDVTYSALLSAQSDYDMVADAWGGNINVLATNSSGIFPGTRSTGQGYGFKIDVPALQGDGQMTRDTPMRFSRSGRAKRGTISGSPLTITLF